MIRFDVTDADLMRRIDQHAPGWRESAKTKTDLLIKAGFYEEKDGTDGEKFWREILPVYIALQGGKCAYCECSLDETPREWDLEHFRPKNSVAKWPSAKRAKKEKIKYDFDTGPESRQGYYALAYAPWNYLAACDLCNRQYKLNFFPIAGTRARDEHARLDDAAAYTQESPYLAYPLGTSDTDPLTLITFDGIIARPTSLDVTTKEYRWGKIIIDIFDLNMRPFLQKQRAQKIIYLWNLFMIGDRFPELRDEITQTIQIQCSSSRPHANCGRAFWEKWRSDPNAAYKDYREACIRLKQPAFSVIPRW